MPQGHRRRERETALRDLALLWLADKVDDELDRQPPVIAVSAHGGSVEVRTVDRGPGIPETQWDHGFLPTEAEQPDPASLRGLDRSVKGQR